MLTALQIFELASALIYETTGDDADSAKFSIMFLNIHLQECLKVENSIRRANEDTELTEAPWITTLNDNVDYSADLTRIALPYIMASHFYTEAINLAMAQYFKDEYDRARSEAAVYKEEDITDAYATEA